MCCFTAFTLVTLRTLFTRTGTVLQWWQRAFWLLRFGCELPSSLPSKFDECGGHAGFPNFRPCGCAAIPLPVWTTRSKSCCELPRASKDLKGEGPRGRTSCRPHRVQFRRRVRGPSSSLQRRSSSWVNTYFGTERGFSFQLHVATLSADKRDWEIPARVPGGFLSNSLAPAGSKFLFVACSQVLLSPPSVLLL